MVQKKRRSARNEPVESLDQAKPKEATWNVCCLGQTNKKANSDKIGCGHGVNIRHNPYVEEEEEEIVYLPPYIRLTSQVKIKSPSPVPRVVPVPKIPPKPRDKKSPVTEVLESYFVPEEPFDGTAVGPVDGRNDLEALLQEVAAEFKALIRKWAPEEEIAQKSPEEIGVKSDERKEVGVKKDKSEVKRDEKEIGIEKEKQKTTDLCPESAEMELAEGTIDDEDVY
ncbi:hypothetical protein C2G38_2240111 [Gigaspora rosea]|uniref:Uncharacterized protein n=1 Tax=Gigaspora rosea TaxID=44941 RepID=A0A397W5C9_9GLOM|nr:hypothetical protein C2G38_2240111 [Gigaspora rosea]